MRSGLRGSGPLAVQINGQPCPTLSAMGLARPFPRLRSRMEKVEVERRFSMKSTLCEKKRVFTDKRSRKPALRLILGGLLVLTSVLLVI